MNFTHVVAHNELGPWTSFFWATNIEAAQEACQLAPGFAFVIPIADAKDAVLGGLMDVQ